MERYTPLAAQVRARRESFCFWTIFFYLGGCSEAAMGGGGAQRPVWRVNEPKKTGARSAGAHARPKPTSFIIYSSRVLCLSYSCLSSCRPVIFLSSCHSCGTLSYSLCFSDQTDQGNETEGLEMEGL
jgi:hypothetical protein